MNEEAAPRILIVEDEAVIAAEIEITLLRMGYLALDLLASCQPDLALLDINIKGTRSGIDLANIIRQKYSFPFVFLTAFADRETLSKVKGTLPYGYVVKPFNDNDLHSAIELALHKYTTEQDPALPDRATLNARLVAGLSPREYEVLLLLHDGLSYRQVAERLHLGVNTIKTYQKALFAKAGISSRHQLSAWVKSIN